MSSMQILPEQETLIPLYTFCPPRLLGQCWSLQNQLPVLNQFVKLKCFTKIKCVQGMGKVETTGKKHQHKKRIIVPFNP